MPNRIASINVDGVSVWDVLFPMKPGQIDPHHDFADYHKEMLSAALDRPVEDLSEFTWLESMRALLPFFQRRVEDGSTPFREIRSLYFVKLSLNRHDDGSHWISFQTEFYDPHVDEPLKPMRLLTRTLTAVLAGSLLILAGCDSLDLEPKDEIESDQVFQDPALAESFLKLVDEYKMDNQGDALCFFVQDPTVSPDRVKTAVADSDRLVKVGEIVRDVRARSQAPDADHRALLAELIQRFDETGGA